MAETLRPVPTVNDLRVKLCYICREEERYDSPDVPAKAWTHPCNCTLVAHETCLLQWIQTSQGSPSKANALKCPQCGAAYEITSEKPPMYTILDKGNHVISRIAQLVTAAGMSSVVITIGTGIYVVSTAYGMYAIREFIGREMYDIILSDDTSSWPWQAYFNLPMIPLALMLSRTTLSSSIAPFFLAWPMSRPVSNTLLKYPLDASLSTELPPLFTWPPSPTMFLLVVLPLTKAIYANCLTRLTHYVLSTKARPSAPIVLRGRQRRNGPLRDMVWQIRLGGEPVAAGRAPAVVAGPRADAAVAVQPDDAAAAANANAERDAANANAAENIIHVTTVSLGRLVGGALIIPPIASFTGSLLLRLSHRIPLLRAFLGVRPPLRSIPNWDAQWFPLGMSQDKWNGLGPWMQMLKRIRLSADYLARGSTLWAMADPVWWRNSLGLGLFVVVKDCIHILHLWYVKQELASRKVKSKSFAGVDVRELDLIDPARWIVHPTA